MHDPTQVLPARVARHVVVDDNGCWLWTRALNGASYGVACWDSKLWRVHRLAWHSARCTPQGADTLHPRPRTQWRQRSDVPQQARVSCVHRRA